MSVTVSAKFSWQRKFDKTVSEIHFSWDYHKVPNWPLTNAVISNAFAGHIFCDVAHWPKHWNIQSEIAPYKPVTRNSLKWNLVNSGQFQYRKHKSGKIAKKYAINCGEKRSLKISHAAQSGTALLSIIFWLKCMKPRFNFLAHSDRLGGKIVIKQWCYSYAPTFVRSYDQSVSKIL